ncbi:YgiT-type zinc finger domain protein [Cylindrospermum stagnale PCC 7417]|uniref:YgiT-type zinc finger domain protein n=1 Tax=Cylindrospermum stagnale PCC 7417 TaxID=56107 RepID=K9X3T4_9NOST|nr:YgiT-type zinc finger protein [Cylindrospermum stagnale]AFZ27320.1 YgiT-type zinc finger domain protein [Cylindrospermum stagnale PCC 7417]
MLPFDECPVCAGQIVEQEVTEIISSGKKKAALKLSAYVCCRCSERFYSLKSIQHIEKIRAELEG